MMRLIQKYKFTTFTYELIEDGIKYRYRRFFQKNEGFIPYEEIPEDKVIMMTDVPKKSLLTAIITTIIALFIFVSYFFTKNKTDEIETTFFYLSISSIFWIYFWLNHTTFKVLANDKWQLIFAEKSPSKESVESFINQIIKIRNAYLEEKYNIYVNQYDTTGSSISTEIFKLFKLKEQNIISDEEYVHLKNELVQVNNKVHNPVGFIVED